jgi:hypothetical protein
MSDRSVLVRKFHLEMLSLSYGWSPAAAAAAAAAAQLPLADTVV